MQGFLMTPEICEDFFRRCIARGAKTEAEKVLILNEIVNELTAIKLNEKDLKRYLKGKKVLHIKRSKNANY